MLTFRKNVVRCELTLNFLKNKNKLILKGHYDKDEEVMYGSLKFEESV